MSSPLTTNSERARDVSAPTIVPTRGAARCHPLLIGAALGLARLAVGYPQEIPTFPTETRLVTVDALVLDRDGNPVSGLGAEDFLIIEDGVPQEIVSFEAFDTGRPYDLATSASPATPEPVASNLHAPPPGSRTFVLLVDDLGIAPHRDRIVTQTIDRFVSDGLRDGDELLFLTTSGSIRWNARMPEGREDVRAVAARIRGARPSPAASDFMTDWEAYQITRFGSPTGARLESSGVPASSDDFGVAIAAPTTSITERVVTRWLERRFCDPDAVGPGREERPGVPVCRSWVVRRAQAIDQARINRTRDLLARINEAVFALSPYPGRKALLLLTEGFLNDPDLDFLQLVAGRCREANIAIYSLDARGLVPALDDLGAASSGGAPNAPELSLMRQERLYFESAGNMALAEDTGGYALRETNELGSAAVRIADESRVYYLLGIVPPPGKGPLNWRSLRVSTRRPGLTVRARRGYTLRNAAEIQRTDREALAARTRLHAQQGDGVHPPPLEASRALASGLDLPEIPLRTMAFTFGSRIEGRVHTLVALEADLGRVANLGGEDHPATVLSLSVAVIHRDTGEVRRVDQQVKVDAGRGGPGFDGWLMLSREFDLRPGVNEARIVVRDEFLGRTGAVTMRLKVPTPEGMWLSTPILTDRTLARRPGEAPQPVLLARRAFGTDGTLYCQYEIFGVAVPPGETPRVEASYEVRGERSRLVRQWGPRPLLPDGEGRLIHLFTLSLDGLAAGPYRLVLRVQDPTTGAVREAEERFRLQASRSHSYRSSSR